MSIAMETLFFFLPSMISSNCSVIPTARAREFSLRSRPRSQPAALIAVRLTLTRICRQFQHGRVTRGGRTMFSVELLASS
ncbi:hypothetical protein ARMGADRAFT_570949 [Armillaria gallica]|uniref:Uncharacterized protein n=1 Tax=Armillaria gallica TaxID=47427 RepID=A0A2H3E3D0_ARMGA|nr:hypothetical protein ARMGADRAFT_570949 [Armillaria gallica]